MTESNDGNKTAVDISVDACLMAHIVAKSFDISVGTFTGLRSRAAARPWSFVGDNVVQLSGFDPAAFEVIVGDVQILIPLLL